LDAENTLLKDIHSTLDLSTSSSIRIDIWRNTIMLGQKNPIWGVGPGDVREDVKQALLEGGNKEYATGNFNMHNQFLESFVGLGALGLICLISILFFGIKTVYKRQNSFSWLLQILLLLIIVNFLFESVLNRQSGLFFFLFFLSLFAAESQKLLQASGHSIAR